MKNLKCLKCNSEYVDFVSTKTANGFNWYRTVLVFSCRPHRHVFRLIYSQGRGRGSGVEIDRDMVADE